MRGVLSSVSAGFVGAFALGLVGCSSPSSQPDDAGSTDSSVSTCGNGTPEGVEACDDGNLAGNDGCSPTCTIEPSDLTVTIDRASTQLDPTSTRPIEFSVVFSRPVVGFAGTQVSFAGSTVPGTLLASVGGSGASYVVFVSGMTGSGNVVASVPAGSVVDAAGTPNLASTSTDASVAFSSTTPTVTIDQTGAQADPTGTSPITFAAIFSQSVTGFQGSDVSFAGSTSPGPLAATVTGSGTTYAVSVTGMSGSGSVVVSVPAGSAANVGGVTNAASTSSDNAVTFNAPAPAVTIDQAPMQADPTSSAPVAFRVVFSQSVTGFTSGDVVLSSSSAPGTLVATVSGPGPVYTVSVSGMTGAGTVVATIPAAAASNLGGTPSLASTSSDNAVTYSP